MNAITGEMVGYLARVKLPDGSTQDVDVTDSVSAALATVDAQEGQIAELVEAWWDLLVAQNALLHTVERWHTNNAGQSMPNVIHDAVVTYETAQVDILHRPPLYELLKDRPR